MNLIQEKELNKIAVNHEVFQFELARDGVYLTSITAKCKNWLQNARRRFNDDDLAIELDSFPFYELQGKKKEFSSPASWNGNELRNTRKTCCFITSLKSGVHEIKFIADVAPFLEKIEIYELDQNEHKTLTLDEKLIPVSENGRLAFDIVIKNVELENIDISARAEHKDKLQMKVDGNIEENPTSKKYKIWYWIGSQLKGDKKDLKKDIKSPQGLFHSLEFKGKGNPIIENIVFFFKDVHFNKLGKIVLYKDIISSNIANLRSRPVNESDDTIIAELKDGDIVEVIEEVVNEAWVPSKSYVWHKVKYQEKTGYVLSSFVEIQGQERDRIIEIIRQKAKEIGVQENWMLALAGCESRFKVYAASDKDPIIAAKGIFQLTTPAINQLKNLGLIINKDEEFEINKNIEGGIKYFKWLYESFYKNKKQALEKTVVAYNVGQGEVPPGLPLDLNKISKEQQRERAKKYLEAFLENNKRKDWKNIFWPIVLLIILVSPAVSFVSKINTPNLLKANLVETQDIVSLQPKSAISAAVNDGLRKFYFNNVDLQGDNGGSSLMDLAVEGIYDPQKYDGVGGFKTKITYKHNDEEDTVFLDYFLYNAYLYDIDGHGSSNLVVEYGEGKSAYTKIFIYNYKTKILEPIKFVKKNGEIFKEVYGRLAFIPEIGLEDSIGITDDYSKKMNTAEACYGFIETIYKHDFMKEVFKEKEVKDTGCVRQPES